MTKIIVSAVLIFFGAFEALAAESFHVIFPIEDIQSQFRSDLESEFKATRALRADNTYALNGVRMNARCRVFINKEANLGVLGSYAINEIVNHKNDYPALLSSRGISQYCGSFAKLDLRQKSIIWTLILTAMAQFESSCDEDATAAGPNGTARGLFQLHQGREEAYDGDDDACIRNASYDDEASVKCALGMLNRQMNNTGGLIFYNKSYWDVLRPNGEAGTSDDIARALARSPLCNLK